MNYIRVHELTSNIIEYETALSNIQELAGKLVHNKTGLSIDITIKEAIPEQSNNFGKGNAGEGMEVQDAFYMIFGSNLQRIEPPKPKPKHILSGLSQDNMPPEIALIMLGSIRRWYQESLDHAKKELEDELTPKGMKLKYVCSPIQNQLT